MTTKGNILIVDDDVDFVAVSRIVLESQGYKVSTAYSGQEGLAKAKKEHPELIVLDVMMRSITEGFHVAREIRDDPDLANTPILMLSSVNSEFPPVHVDRGTDWLPADKLLDKPIDGKQLVAEIEDMLQSRAQK
jgi:DNA-binding response OmpR family regulator